MQDEKPSPPRGRTVKIYVIFSLALFLVVVLFFSLWKLALGGNDEASPNTPEEGVVNILVPPYPTYITLMNITDGTEGVTAGCVHGISHPAAIFFVHERAEPLKTPCVSLFCASRAIKSLV